MFWGSIKIKTTFRSVLNSGRDQNSESIILPHVGDFQNKPSANFGTEENPIFESPCNIKHNFTARFSSSLISHTYIHIKFHLTLPFSLNKEMCELYCEFTLENIIMFTNISLRRSEHKSRDFVGVRLKRSPSIQTDCVGSLGVEPKWKKSLNGKVTCQKSSAKECPEYESWWCCCPQAINTHSVYEAEMRKPARIQNQQLDKEM